MTAALPVAAMGLYLWGVRRWEASREPWPVGRVAAFVGGILVLLAALAGPIETGAASRFSVHMVQHLMLTMVAAPLLLLGRPLLLARRTLPPRGRRALQSSLRHRWLRWLTFPPVAWGVFVAVMWASHFTSLYQLALEGGAVHAAEHALYLGASLLFWLPVLAVEPSPWHLGHGARLLYLFLAVPANALLASTLYQAQVVLYPAYAGPEAVADQRTAGAIMWIGGGVLMLCAVLLVAASWARHERAAGERADALLETAG